MRDDEGSSIVVGFVILLMIVALGIGIWALISLPAELKAAESSHALGLQNAFLDLKVSADKVRVNDLSGARFSMLIPGGSGMSGTTISFTENTGGGLYLQWDGSSGVAKKWETIGRLSAQVGGARGSTVIGYEGGGVFRSDNGKGVWLTPGLIEVYPDPAETNATIRVDLVVITMEGKTMVSSNRGVPVDCLYTGSNDTILQSVNETLTISFTSDDPDQRSLWFGMFEEAASRYQLAAETYQEKVVHDKITPEITNGAATLKIPGGGDSWVKVYIREATYDVSLVSGQ